MFAKVNKIKVLGWVCRAQCARLVSRYGTVVVCGRAIQRGWMETLVYSDKYQEPKSKKPLHPLSDVCLLAGEVSGLVRFLRTKTVFVFSLAWAWSGGKLLRLQLVLTHAVLLRSGIVY